MLTGDAHDDPVDVVRLVGRVGDEGVEFLVGLVDLVVGGDRDDGRLVEVVGRQVGQQQFRELDGVLLVRRLVMGDAGLRGVRVRPAEFLEGDVFTGDGLDHVGAGDEHMAGALDHEGEVGDRGGVHRPARRGAHDKADLRDDTGRAGVAEEDLREQAQRDDAFLDAGAAAVADPDDGAAGLHGVVHDLDDLLAVNLAQGPAEDGEVLGVHRDRAPVDQPGAGDHPVPVGAVLLDAEVVGPVPGQLVELGEGPLVKQQPDPLAGGQLALGVLLLDRRGRPGVHRLVTAPLQVRDLPRGRMRIRSVIGRAVTGQVKRGRHRGERSLDMEPLQSVSNT